jgi:hypothetical protein
LEDGKGVLTAFRKSKKHMENCSSCETSYHAEQEMGLVFFGGSAEVVPLEDSESPPRLAGPRLSDLHPHPQNLQNYLPIQQLGPNFCHVTHTMLEAIAMEKWVLVP